MELSLDHRVVKPPTTFTRFARKCNLSSALLSSDLGFFQHFMNRITILFESIRSKSYQMKYLHVYNLKNNLMMLKIEQQD